MARKRRLTIVEQAVATLRLPSHEGWACHDEEADPKLFDETRDIDAIMAARSFCARCPRIAECLVRGRASKGDGTWGGQLLVDGKVQRLPDPADVPDELALVG